MPQAVMAADGSEGTPSEPKDALLRQADQMLYAEQHANRSGLAGAYELKWLALLLLALAVPVGAAPYVLSAYYALLVCYYGAIVAFVVAGWGMVRAYVTARRGKSVYRFIAMLYLAFFLLFFVIYGSLMFSPTLDKRWGLHPALKQRGLQRKGT
ncbi:MAG: hypothetical protein KIS92_10865 [Planctomycetota bacterium]|nr:hypothetical protein [Planctomycetota bacterium]